MIERIDAPAPAARAVPATCSPRWPSAVAMLGLALIVYLPAALRAGFLDFDDNFFFGPQNPEFQQGIGAVLDPGRPIANAWLPVAHLSLWLEYRLFGAVPFVPHLAALLLHGTAGFLLVRLLLAIGARASVALLAGAWFVAHPALAESVAWVSGRKDVLAGLFGFAALLQTARFARTGGAPRALGIALLGALAMYSKATAVVLPALSFLVCLCIGGPRRRFLAPLVLLGVTVPIALHHQAIAVAEGTLAAGESGERLAQVPGALWHYIATAFWPVHLNVLYPEVDTLAAFRAALAPAAGVVAAALLAALAAWRRPAWRLASLGVLAFFVALLPFNTAYPASSIAAADRYLYFALPGATLAGVAVLQRLMGTVGLALAGALLVPLVWLAGSRAHDFGDDETLWRASLATGPVNAVARLNLVYELLQRGPAEVDEVRAHLEAAAAAARYPIHELRARSLLVRVAMQQADYVEAAHQAQAAIAAARAQLALESSPKRRQDARTLLLQALLAAFEPLRQAGDPAGAEASHAEAKTIAPDHPDVVAFDQWRALGAVAAELRAAAASGGPARLPAGDARAAAADAALATALARHPGHAGLLCMQAEWDKVRDRVLAALANYRRAQAADPQCIDAWLGAARLLRERENYGEAELYARRGLEHRPDPALRQELALALVGQGRLDDAILQLEAYLRLRPQDQDAAKVLANVLIGRAYARLGEGGAAHAEVLRLVERALAYNPNEGKAHLVIGRLAREQRRLTEAVSHLETAHRLLPDFDEARRQLAEALADLGYQRVLQRDDQGAGDAWLRCLAVAPADFDVEGIRTQMAAIWRRLEARGVERWKAGDRAGAIADFRRCLALDPDQHWAAWLLASVLRDEPGADLEELERLCRQAVAWQDRHGLDGSQQVLLLALTLLRRGQADASQAVARDFLLRPSPDAKPQILAALRRLAGE